MPSRLITTQSILRYIHRSTDDAQSIPQLDQDYTDIYKGEIVVNYSRESPALYLRVGAGTEEAFNDNLVRIGNVIVSDTEPYLEESTLTKRGLTWLDSVTNQLYIHNGSSFIRVTNVAATELIEGIVRRATEAEVVLGDEAEGYVSPATLKAWADYYEFTTRRWGTKTVYVSNYDGDDSVNNDGSEPSRPFLTINRAIIEMGRRPIQTIIVQSGDYLVDNRMGVSDPNLISALTIDVEDGEVGPINPKALPGVLTQLNLNGTSGDFTLETNLDWNLYKDQQVFFEADGKVLGHAIVDSPLDVVSGNPVYFRNLKGTVVEGVRVQIGHLSSFNSVTGGIIIPASCSLVAQGNVHLRPIYIPEHTLTETPDRTYLFKFAHGCIIQGFIFKDSSNNSSHYLYSCLTNATGEDLINADYSIKAKLDRVFNKGFNFSPSYVNHLPFLRVIDVSLVGYYGTCFLDLEMSYLESYKDIIISGVACAVSQKDERFVVDGDPTEGNKHWFIRVEGLGYSLFLNGGYVRYTPELVIDAEGTDATVNIDGLRWDP